MDPFLWTIMDSIESNGRSTIKDEDEELMESLVPKLTTPEFNRPSKFNYPPWQLPLSSCNDAEKITFPMINMILNKSWQIQSYKVGFALQILHRCQGC